MIEPEFFVPILPMVLVNGTEGIGTGFSSYVPSFNPDDIKENILRVIQGQPLEKMKPWFKGFKGTITPVPESTDSWIAEGVWKGTTITELPPGKWTQDYKEFLDELVEAKTISGYDNDSTTDSVSFTIRGYTGDDFCKDFKLRKTIHATNMHLFHPVTGIKKYASAEEILVDFVEVRIEYYKKRKAHLIQTLEKELVILENKVRFVQMVTHGDFIIFKRKKASIEEELTRKFTKVDGSFDYLLNIKTWQYSDEAVADLKKAFEKTTKELETLKATHVMNMWKSDIIKY
jgi:DNA topoisomerase-2